ncbi:MAG: SDR family oxidoreductase [Deltaproteobacteria bacterium]|jgi:NAD(P)-dependent dehydrogenase (short-subunit alcohol dehydrogenase family)|nr:SDR family oxidoreductase [Deltaproteobacteria bacterium]
MMDLGLKSKVDIVVNAAYALCRVGTPEEAADLILFLASERTGWITGETITEKHYFLVWIRSFLYNSLISTKKVHRENFLLSF